MGMCAFKTATALLVQLTHTTCMLRPPWCRRLLPPGVQLLQVSQVQLQYLQYRLEQKLQAEQVITSTHGAGSDPRLGVLGSSMALRVFGAYAVASYSVANVQSLASWLFIRQSQGQCVGVGVCCR